MTDKITLKQLKVYHGQVGDIWKAIKDGNREALFALELAWTIYAGMRGHYHDDYTEVGLSDFSKLVQAVSDKYGDRSPEDYICGGLVEGMRRAIDRGEDNV